MSAGRRLGLVVGVALLVSWCLPALAFGHATLERTVPSQGSDVDSAPPAVELYFSEPVETSFGSLRVYSAEGDEVAAGDTFRPGDDAKALGIALPADLSDGTYTATYRVISADSHPVSGGFSFSIGTPSATGALAVGDLLDEAEPGTVTDAAFWLIRLLGYLAIGLAVGALWFFAWPWARGRAAGAELNPAADRAFARRTRNLLGAAIVAGLLASLLAIVAQGAVASGGSLWSAFDRSVIDGVIATRYGTVLAVRAGVWLALAVLLAILFASGRIGATRRPEPWVATLVTVPCLALAITPALAGHAATQSPQLLLVPANAIHVLAMCLWFGGIAALLYAVPAATRTLQGPARGELLSAVIERFSPVALACVCALALTGTIQSIIELGNFGALIDTGSGRAILAKIAGLAILIGLGAHNRRRLLPALAKLAAARQLPGRVGLAIRRNLRVELALIVAVLGVTALLVSYPPPSQVSAGPVSGRVEAGPAELEYTVDPAQSGANQIHLYLFDAVDGSQFTSAKGFEATIENAEEDIGPLEVPLTRSGSGHWLATAALFPVPGDWNLDVTFRTSAFDQYEADAEIEVD